MPTRRPLRSLPDLLRSALSRRRQIAAAPVALALWAGAASAPAHAAGVLVIDGRGFGHGVGLSQYGAYGYALHGTGYRDILRHYYRGTRIQTTSTARTVRVLLASGLPSATVTGADTIGGRPADPGRAYRITVTKNGGLRIRDDRGRRFGYVDGALQATAGGGTDPVVLAGRSGDGVTDGGYRGALVLQPEAGRRLSVVNAIGLEDYLRGVVGAESPSDWPAQALRAQAVAARTYAIATDAGTTGDAFTQYADTRSQVYRGVAAETAATDAAVAATTGEVVTYQGAPIVAYFFSTSGGRTEDVQHAFPGAEPRPYLRSVRDPYDTTSPKHTWRVTLTAAEAQARLGGLVKGTLRRIRVLERGTSRRVVRARIIGSAGTTEVDGPTLRKHLHLYDTWARFRTVTTTPSTRRRTVIPSTAAVVRDARVDAQTGPPAAGLLAAAVDEASGWTIRAVVASQPTQPVDASALAQPTPRPRHIRVRTLRGRVTGERHRLTVRVQRGRGGGRWTTVATVRSSARGIYAARVTRPGVYRVRVGTLTGPRVRVR